MSEQIDKEAQNAAVKYAADEMVLGKEFGKHFGVHQIIRAYEQKRGDNIELADDIRQALIDAHHATWEHTQISMKLINALTAAVLGVLATRKQQSTGT